MAATPSPTPTTPVRIMVVEDDALQRRVVGHYLRSRGFDVTMARDGLEALGQIARDVPRLIVLDLSMPEINGIELLRVIRKHPGYRDIPVVVTTGSTDPGPRDEAAGLGVRCQLVKSEFSLTDLLEAIRANLADGDRVA